MAPSYRPDGTGVRTFVRSNVKDDRPLAGPDPAGSAVLLLAQPSSGYAGILYDDAVAISMTLTANLAGSGTGSSNPSPSSGESGANLSLAGIRPPTSRSRGFPRVCGLGERLGRQRRARSSNIAATVGAPLPSGVGSLGIQQY